ncbi:MAG: ATP-binding cassette domain-containing protein [Desulfobacteraceae bacterium]|nr:MAG: ATP-binding cassette domain-containing protein [Desulfobacteraceae bacterium]
MALYEIDQLVHSYRKRAPVLCIDHWTVTAGGIIGLTGPNGSGKSTLLKLLGLVEQPSRGEIRFEGRKTDPFAAGLRHHIALLPQETHLLKRSVHKNIAYGLRIRNDRKAEAERIGEAMSLVGLSPDLFAKRPWFALSGGEARRVALAARLVLRPRVLLLDEPTASVDDPSAQLMNKAIVHAHRQWGTSLIIASHDAQWLLDVCDDMVHLFQGRLLSRSRRTLLYGPWQHMDDRHVGMQLADGQVFIAVKPPAGEDAAVAVVDPARLSMAPPGRLPAGRRSVEGVLTRLTLDKRSGGIEASIAVGPATLSVCLPAEDLAAGGLVPGRKVSVAYDPQDVQWH